MAFHNSILAGEELVRSGIRSENYVPGVAGWRVDRLGNAEFNDVTVRGIFIAGQDPGAHIKIDPNFLGAPAILFYPDVAVSLDPALLFMDGPTGELLMRAIDLGGPFGPAMISVEDVTARIRADTLLFADTSGATFPAFTTPLGADPFAPVRSSVVVQASPAGNDDANAAAFAAWGPAPTTPAPDWATSAQVVVGVMGVFAITALGGFQFRLTLDGTPGISVAASSVDFANSPRVSYSWVDQIAVVGGQPVTVQLEARRSSGGGSIRADTSSDFTYQVTWLP